MRGFPAAGLGGRQLEASLLNCSGVAAGGVNIVFESVSDGIRCSQMVPSKSEALKKFTNFLLRQAAKGLVFFPHRAVLLLPR